MISSAIAQSLTPVAAGTSGFSWTWAIIIGAVVLCVAGFVYLKRKNPAAATVVSADAAHVASTISSALSAEFVKLRELLQAKIQAQSPASIPAAEPPAAPPPAGKSGTAGTFTLQVTGDPKVDLPALTAAYLG